jgi:hypothetical protein
LCLVKGIIVIISSEGQETGAITPVPKIAVKKLRGVVDRARKNKKNKK